MTSKAASAVKLNNKNTILGNWETGMHGKRNLTIKTRS
jgi:hypothetical protein